MNPDVEQVCALLDQAAEVLARDHTPDEVAQAQRWLHEAAMMLRVMGAAQP